MALVGFGREGLVGERKLRDSVRGRESMSHRDESY